MNDTPAIRIEDLGDILQQFKREHVLLIVDSIAYASSGAQDRIRDLLQTYQVRLFSEFEPNPKLHEVIEGAKLLSHESSDIVVAIGGGTAIDMAKLICCCAAQGKVLSEPEIKQLFSDTSGMASRIHPLIAVPTTAGTGSEATQFAVVYIEDKKYSVSHPSLLPDAAILDSSLTHSVPKGTTIASGLDAVVHSIESLWSIRSTETSIAIAEQALQLGLANIEKVITSSDDKNREAMLQAAHLAGKAINITRTTAAHALSYTMTIRHNIPHGMAVALCLGPFLRFNAAVDSASLADRRGLEHIQRIFSRLAEAFDVDPSQENFMDDIADCWEQLLQRIGCATKLSDWGISQDSDLKEIASSVNQHRLGNNPRRVSEEDLITIVNAMA